ncbi:ABC transporter permease [uncultured Nocardioides sp.]|uniref:ABC transporter permease n=1 Tax=uncultured Nocardioides sp. TaxID=198441 RepID=UPI002609D6E2|nr:ABC transporter permease [uncultured Nocardioides sp.]
MFAFIVKRLLAGLLVLGTLVVSIFVLFWYGPRSPVQGLCEQRTNNRCTSEFRAQLEENFGYNNPMLSELGKYVGGIFTGRDIQLGASTFVECSAPCLGLSYRTFVPAFDELIRRLPATISLAVGAAVIILLVGVTSGVLAARRRGTVADKALVSATLLMSSIPYVLFALLIYLYLNVINEVFPEAGYTPLTENPVAWLSGLLLPWLALGLYNSTQYTRFSRGAMIDALSEDYIRTARAKGLSSRTVTFKHGLRSALVPIVTIFGIDFAFLLAGTIFTEIIFGINGIGRWGLEAIQIEDFPVVQTTVLFGAIVVIVANIVVDILYGVLDPRVRIS